MHAARRKASSAPGLIAKMNDPEPPRGRDRIRLMNPPARHFSSSRLPDAATFAVVAATIALAALAAGACNGRGGPPLPGRRRGLAPDYGALGRSPRSSNVRTSEKIQRNCLNCIIFWNYYNIFAITCSKACCSAADGLNNTIEKTIKNMKIREKK